MSSRPSTTRNIGDGDFQQENHEQQAEYYQEYYQDGECQQVNYEQQVKYHQEYYRDGNYQQENHE